MSNNPKNIIRKEFLKNYTKNVENRVVLVQKNNNYGEDINEVIAQSNSSINIIVQDINVYCHDRQIPYITLIAKYGDKLNDDVRILLRNYYTKESWETNIGKNYQENKEISHLIDFLIVNGFNEIKISSLMLDAELIIGKNQIINAITDIILDILMFNSYSFLQKLTIAERKEFSIKKFEYFKEQNLSCCYDYSGEELLYYSLAFSSRDDDGKFNIETYLNLWSNFLKKYYPNKSHEELTVKKQIEMHVDYGELPKDYHKKFYNKPSGAYLIIRTNKDRTPKKQNMVNSTFGLKKYEYGRVKIVPIERFFELKPIFENLDVSVFKVVKP